MSTKRESSTQWLHPLVRFRAEALIADLHQAQKDGKIKTWFMPFETLRSPIRQAQLYRQGRSEPGAVVTQAEPWASAHQLGLALDIVPYMPKEAGSSLPYRWSWEAPDFDLAFLAQAAVNRGFKKPPNWDNCHIEDPLFDDFQMIGRARYGQG